MGYVTVKYKITSDFGAVETVREGAHTGIDLAMAIGTKLRSVVDGEVLRVFSGFDAIGKGVLILGNDGREYIYGHMSNVKVKPGEEISMGSLLGESGSTGNSTGPHLHFSVRENGEYIDPIGYKATLDKLIGDLTPSDLPWYDLEGRFSLAVDNKMDELQEQFTEAIVAFLQAVVDVVVDLSYSIALIGGGMLILLRVMGVRRATKYFFVLQFVNVMIQSLFAGGVSWENGRDLITE